MLFMSGTTPSRAVSRISGDVCLGRGGRVNSVHTFSTPTLSTPMLFMSSTTPSRAVFMISGGVCSGKVSLKCAELKRR